MKSIKRFLKWNISSGFIFVIIAFAYILFVAAVARGDTPATQPTTQPLGVWYQPTSSFSTWQARGVTMLIGYEGQGGSVTCDAWTRAAQAAGFHYVLQSEQSGSNQTAAHFNDANCDAVQLGIDEPNQLNANQQLPAALLAKAQALRAKTFKPLYINMDGQRMRYQSDDELWAYFTLADWIGFDLYACNTGNGISAWDTIVYPQLLRMKRLAPGKRILLFVECSDQNLKIQPWVAGAPLAAAMHGPSTDEFLHEIRTARAWGCTPALFPDVIGLNFQSYDGTPAGIDGALRALGP